MSANGIVGLFSSGWSWAVLLVALLSLVEVSKIKINPWSALLKWMGKCINGELISRMGKLELDVASLKKDLASYKDSSDEQDMVDRRVRILAFGDELLYDEKRHSKERFDQILMDITLYQQYCDTHPDFKNKMTEMTTRHITDVYAERLEKGDFLIRKEEHDGKADS